MHFLFQDPSFSFELLRALGYAVSGGADIGECLSTASRIHEGDFESWYTEWSRMAERVEARASASLARGSHQSAREAYLRASNYYRCAEFYLHTTPGDERGLPTWEKSRSCFRQALRLLEYPCEEVEIPYEGTTLPGYFYRADPSPTPRPTLIVHGGYDSTGEELYFMHALAALQRGYHCLTFEGPGQGRVIRLQHVPFRPDWEAVVTPVVNFLGTQPHVDPQRLALLGVSFGGYLAPRAAAYEHRLAACIAVDGVFSFFEGIQPFFPRAFSERASAQGQDLEALYQAAGQVLMQQSITLRWAITQGMWTFGAPSLSAYVRLASAYTMEGIAGQITCPTLICDGEHDQFFAGQAKKLYDALTCSKSYHLFSEEEGAGEHCQAGASLRLNQEVFEWLDEVFSQRR